MFPTLENILRWAPSTLLGVLLAACLTTPGAYAQPAIGEPLVPQMEPLPEIIGLSEEECPEEWVGTGLVVNGAEALIPSHRLHCLEVVVPEKLAESTPDLHLDVLAETSNEGADSRSLVPITITVTNQGAGESTEQLIEVAFAGRHDIDPDGEVVAMEVIAAVVDNATGCLPGKDNGLRRRTFTCDLPSLENGGSRDIHFLVSAPPAGVLAWDVALSNDDNREEGSVPVRPPSGAAPTEPAANILRVVVAEKQVGFGPQGGRATYYPFSPTRTETGGEDRRRLLVVGQNLPKFGVTDLLNRARPLTGAN